VAGRWPRRSLVTYFSPFCEGRRSSRAVFHATLGTFVLSPTAGR
jgi:hypothetical protein